MLRDHHRIVVVGTSGSGKTIFARQLAGILDYAHIELDALHWGPNWTAQPEFPELVRGAIIADNWVVDGNYRTVRDQVWARATASCGSTIRSASSFVAPLLERFDGLFPESCFTPAPVNRFAGRFLKRMGFPGGSYEPIVRGVMSIQWHFLSRVFNI